MTPFRVWCMNRLQSIVVQHHGPGGARNFDLVLTGVLAVPVTLTVERADAIALAEAILAGAEERPH